MPFKTLPRIFETSTTTGVGDYTLDGAQVGFQPFSVAGANNLVPYFATDDVNWEEGIGTYIAGPHRLQRTTILGSSNAGAAVNWGVGTKKIRSGPIAALARPRMLTKAVGGGAGTTVLTQDEQRREVIEFTGALTGNRVIEVDATEWRWIVRNNTTGAFTLTFKVTGQTGIVVPQGRRALIYCDGVDVRGSAGIPGAASEFDSGTPMVFAQTSAPTGWTKSTTHNDKALRVVSGTVGSGGSTAFTSVFGAGKSTASYTLATADIPSHSHTTDMYISTGGGQPAMNATAVNLNAVPTNSVGGGGGHVHGLSLDLQYADVIIATKD